MGARYVDGDDLHPQANIDKMSHGIPLTDEDRWPWLDAVGQVLRVPDVIVGCSALKRSYRDAIRAGAGAEVCFVHLAGEQSVIAARMAARKGHFMPEALLDSQYAALEPPGADETSVTVDIDHDLDRIVADILARLDAP